MAASDAIPVPRKNTAYRFYFAIRKPSDSTLITTWTGADSEVSLDGAAYSDCTNEATEIGTTGTGYIDLTSSEMNADCVMLKVTVTNTGAVPLVFALYPESAGDYRVADNQKVDVETIKTQTLTAAAGITFGVYVGGTAAHSTLTQTQVTGGAYALNSSSFAFHSGLDFTTTQKAATLARVTLVDAVTGMLSGSGTIDSVISSTSFDVSGLLSADTNQSAYVGCLMRMKSGAVGKEEIRRVTGYAYTAGLTHRITIDAAFATSRSPGQTFDLYPSREHTVAEIQSGLSTLDAAGVRSSIGLGSANLDAQLSVIAGDVAGLDGAAMRGTDGAYTGTPPTVTQIRQEFDTNSTKLAAIQDRVSYCLTVLVGACADAGTAAETYTHTIGGETFTADYSGLDATGNRSTTTLSKA